MKEMKEQRPEIVTLAVDDATAAQFAEDADWRRRTDGSRHLCSHIRIGPTIPRRALRWRPRLDAGESILPCGALHRHERHPERPLPQREEPRRVRSSGRPHRAA